MLNRKDLKAIISDALLPHSFVNKGNVWYRINDDLVSFFHLDKSPYGGQFSLGISFLRYDSSVTIPPTWHDSQAFCMIEQVKPEIDYQLIRNAMNLEFVMSTDKRKEIISDCLRSYAIPLINSIRNLNDLEWFCKSPGCALAVTLELKSMFRNDT